MMAAADRGHRAQIRLDADAEQACDRVCVYLTADLGRSVPRTEAVRQALIHYQAYLASQAARRAGKEARS